MGILYFMWRQTSLLAIGGLSSEAQELSSVLCFPIQLFDDLFTGIIFLSVEPFSKLFFAMVVFHFFRDIIRDAGYGWILLDWLRGTCGTTKLDLTTRSRDMLLRYHLCAQNLFSELLANLVIPLAVTCDILFTKFGYGVNTITIGLTQTERTVLLQMFSVLLCVQLLTHAVVIFLLKRQLLAFRGLLARAEEPPNRRKNNFINVTSGRNGLMRLSLEWNAKSHINTYWNTHASYFKYMVTFAVVNALASTSELKHRLL